MLQLIGYLMCFYLVFKGVEILQIGIASSGSYRSSAIAIGVLAFFAAIAIAAFFWLALTTQGVTMSDPRLR